MHLRKKIIRWELTKKCNLNCAHCFNQPFIKKELDAKSAMSLIPMFSELGVKSVSFAGREITLREDFLDLLTECKNRGFITSVSTNGTARDVSYYLKVAEFADDIILSLDGITESSHEKVRGKGTFTKVIEVIKALVNYRDTVKPKLCVTLSSVLLEDLIEEVQGYAAFCHSLGIKVARLSALRSIGNAEKNNLTDKADLGVFEVIAKSYYPFKDELELQLPALPNELRYLNAKYGVDFPILMSSCSAVDQLTIFPDGKAMPCCITAFHADSESLFPTELWWDMLNEPMEKAFKNFPFLYKKIDSAKTNKPEACVNCPEEKFCLLCPLFKSELDTNRCRKITEKLTELKLEFKDNTVFELNSNFEVIENDFKILFKTKDGARYLAKKEYALDPDLKTILKSYVAKNNYGQIIHSHLEEKAKLVAEYFWKEGLLKQV